MEDAGDLDDLPDEVALALGGLGVRYVRALQKEYKQFLQERAAHAQDEGNEDEGGSHKVFRPFMLEGDPSDKRLRYGRRPRHEGLITERTRPSEALLRSTTEREAARVWRHDQSGARRIFTADGERLGDRPQWQYDMAAPYAGLTDREQNTPTELGTRELLSERCAPSLARRWAEGARTDAASCHGCGCAVSAAVRAGATATRG